MAQKDTRDKKRKKQVATIKSESRRSVLIQQIAEILSKKRELGP